MNWYKKAQMAERGVTVQDMGGYRNIVPIITLRGKWLLEAGFFPKDKLSVSVSPDTITLTVVERNIAKRKMLENIKRQDGAAAMRKKNLETAIPINYQYPKTKEL